MKKKPKSKKSHKFLQELHNTKKFSLMHLPSTTPCFFCLLIIANSNDAKEMHLVFNDVTCLSGGNKSGKY
jgi:hypothetical protein